MNREECFVAYDDTIDRLIWHMRDGLSKAVTNAHEALGKFPENALLSVRIRKSGTEGADTFHHPKTDLETVLESLNDTLESRFFAAMEHRFVPYPKSAGKPEVFRESDPKERPFIMIQTTVYPRLVLMAKKIGDAVRAESEEDINRQIGALLRPKPLTLEEVATILASENTENVA